MKTNIILSLSLISLLAMAFVIAPGDISTLEIGEKAPLSELKMKDISGDEISLNDKMDKKGLVVIFSCNTCPFVVGKEGSEGWESRYNEVSQRAQENGIGVILINSNEAKRDKGDSFEDMVQRAKDNRYLMAYSLDKDHVMADAFGARTTPHVFLFNKKFELVYKGAIDDNNDSASDVKETWLLNAMTNLSEGKKINPNSTRNIGCSIKRVKKG